MTDKQINVQDFMTKQVVSVHPETPLLEAAQILMSRNFDGLPVVDHNGILAGLLTEYDLISKSTMIHLPTFQKILWQMSVFEKDTSAFQKNVAEITRLAVRDVMNNDPLTFDEHTSYEDAVKTFMEHHRINPIPVVDAKRKVVGVVSRFDILKPFQFINNHV
ncbi:CBS domain-containing protein [Patescibacteria group bacterium]|nr:CBS domain-containing protein [Patescibacteria group bacterium]